MEISWEKLKPDTLRALVDEFVSRDGTDYGLKEANHETKMEQVLRLLRENKVKIVFDPETESCDIRERR
jgi:uncharacterized protein